MYLCIYIYIYIHAPRSASEALPPGSFALQFATSGRLQYKFYEFYINLSCRTILKILKKI